ncbi:MAG: efflux RND transporter periplasmic adaptor subunit [Treponema sp.]|nr:efflux RND transporter periplasmic adaptor subunit [Treponema sp.]
MKKFLIILAVLLIAAGLIFARSMSTKKNDISAVEKNAATIFTVRTETAQVRTLQAYIEVNANIVSGNQVTVMPDANGRLVSMRVGLGNLVQRGALIAEVDPSRPGTDYSLSPVYAPVSGMVVTNPLTVGSTVSTSSPLMTLAVNSSIEIEALIPEREIGQLRTGLKAGIRLEAFPGETFAATLTLVSPVVDPVSRTRKITLQFDRTDQRIIPGMFSRVKLNTRNYVNVVSVPQEAVVEHRGKTIVYVLDTTHQGDTPTVQAREISIGVTVDGEMEIITGLEPGEAVIVQGQQFLSDGSPVRVIGGR